MSGHLNRPHGGTLVDLIVPSFSTGLKPRTGLEQQALRLKLARAEGMSTLLEEALTLVQNGTTNLAEIMRSVYVMGV